MNVVYISGSPRKKSNTDYLLHRVMDITGGELIKLSDYTIKPCVSCRECMEGGVCIIDDDMKNIVMPRILTADAIVIGTPVYFNNVTAQLKAFMDRTWSIRGRLRNKIGAAVVVGRRYGAEGAITAVNSFLLKHDMIVANRGVSGEAFEVGEITGDYESIKAASELGDRILELAAALSGLRQDGADGSHGPADHKG